jgi:hypothetical protein
LNLDPRTTAAGQPVLKRLLLLALIFFQRPHYRLERVQLLASLSTFSSALLLLGNNSQRGCTSPL